MQRFVLLAAVSGCGFGVHATSPAVLAPGLAVDRFGGEVGLSALTTAVANGDAAAVADARVRLGPRVDTLLAGSWTSTGFGDAANAAGSLRVRRRIGCDLRPVDVVFGGGFGASAGIVGESRWALGTHAFAGFATTDRDVRVFTDAWASAALEHFRSHPIQVGVRYGLDLGHGDVSVRPMVGLSHQRVRRIVGVPPGRRGISMLELGLSLRVRIPQARDQRPEHERGRHPLRLEPTEPSPSP